MATRKSTRQSGETRGRKTKEENLKIKEEELNEKELQIRIDKIILEKGELLKEVNRLRGELDEANKKIEYYNKNKAFYNNEEDTIKAILDEKAKGKPSVMILENLERKGIFLSQEEVDIICENVTDLSIDMQNYYEDKRKEVMKRREVDDSFERANDIEILNMQINRLLKLQNNFSVLGKEDAKEYVAISNQITALLREKGKFNKDMITDDASGLSADVKEIKDSLNKRSSNIVKNLDTSQFRQVN